MICDNQKKRILIISFFSPPSTEVGGKRFLFLSRLLQKKYSELHILTLKEKYIPIQDHSLALSGKIHRERMFPPFPIVRSNILRRIFNRLWHNYFCLIDPYSGWIIPALIKGFKIIKKKKINLIIATGPPFTSMVTGFLLSRLTGATLILDYRDPWTNFERIFCKITGKKLNEIIEKLAVKQACALVFCSQIMKDNFIDSFGQYKKATCHVIQNGFHYKDQIQPFSLGKFKKNMVYAGNFYGERNIKLIARSLLQIFNEGTIDEDDFCFHIFGKLKDDDMMVIEEYGLQGCIEEHSHTDYEELLRYLKGADILVLLSGSDVGYAIPFKFYDYLSVKKPILAITTAESAVADMMNKIDCGRLALVDNQESILSNLRKMILEDKVYTFSGADHYTWEEISKKYIHLIEEIGLPGKSI